MTDNLAERVALEILDELGCTDPSSDKPYPSDVLAVTKRIQAALDQVRWETLEEGLRSSNWNTVIPTKSFRKLK